VGGSAMRDDELTRRARALRANATPPERAVWRILRTPPFDALHFRRQVAFDDRYIADFASHRACVIIEVDGRSHDQSEVADARRTSWFEAQGYRVVRVSNAQATGDAPTLALAIAFLLEL